MFKEEETRKSTTECSKKLGWNIIDGDIYCKSKYNIKYRDIVVYHISIPIAKIKTFDNWYFTTYSSQIEVKKMTVELKFEDEPSCNHHYHLEPFKIEKNDMSNTTWSSFKIPKRFQRSVIDNYKERVHKAFNHLIELSKENGDDLFND